MLKENPKNSPNAPEPLKDKFTARQIERLIAVFSPIPLIKYPYFVSLSRRNRKREILFGETIRDGTNIRWEVKSRDYLPGEMELKVWCWILHKVSQARKPLPPDAYIPYTLTEIAEYWSMPHGGTNFLAIAKAIENLQNTLIHHWVQMPGQPAQDLSYSLVAGRAGKGNNADEELLNKNVIYLDPILIRLLNQGPIKPSSLEQIKLLADTNLIAARLYELLGWKFYFIRANGGDTVSFIYSDLTERIGLKKEKHQSDAKRQFAKAHKCLKKQSIISGTPTWLKVRNDWKIVFKPGENLITEIAEWVRRKKIKGFTGQIEYRDPEIDYALEDIAEYIGKGEEKTLISIVVKVFKKHQQNGSEMVRRAISEAKNEEPAGNIKNKAAYLTQILKKYAK